MKRSEAEKIIENDIKIMLETELYTYRQIASFCIYKMEHLGMLPPESQFNVKKNLDKDLSFTFIEKIRDWEPE